MLTTQTNKFTITYVKGNQSIERMVGTMAKEKIVRIKKVIAGLGYSGKELWSYDELKIVASSAKVAVVDVMYVARYCK